MTKLEDVLRAAVLVGIENGLDNESEVEESAARDNQLGWTQPPLPGLEEL